MPNNVFPYPGNKAQHSDWVLEHLPAHHCYVEPFGGAAGVLFNKEPSEVEIYNDLNGDIVQFFEILREHPDALGEYLRRVPFSRELHERWATAYYDGKRPDGPVERAARFFYLRYSQWGGKIHNNSGFATKQSNDPASPFVEKIEQLGEFSHRLRGVVLENEPWEKMFERYDASDTCFYLDPPYVGTEGNYNSQGFDHHALYESVQNADADCLVSYDSIPKWYDDSFHIATKDAHFAIDNVGGTGPKDAEEVLLMNFNPRKRSLHSPGTQATLADH